jgi:ABC-type multidrug transport system, ATPase and permease components
MNLMRHIRNKLKLSKKENPRNDSVDEKVSALKFFKVQGKIIKELYKKYKFETTIIIILSCTLICVNFIDLKFLEYVTNSVSQYMRNGDTHDFHKISVTIGLFLGAFLIMQILENIYNIIREKYLSKISYEVEKKITHKLSIISYEYYENSEFYDKINFATQASEQYSEAVFGITEILRIILMVIVYGIMLSKINTFFIIIILISIIICVIIATKVTDKQLDYWRLYVSPKTRRNNYFKGVLGNRINHQNIQTTRSFSYFANKNDYYNNQNRKNFLKLNLYSFFTKMSVSILFIITFLITALIVGSEVTKGTYEIGYYSMVIALLTNLFSIMSNFSMFMMSENWYIKVLDAYYEVMNFKDDLLKETFQSDVFIEMKNIAYKYVQSENYALSDININFINGEKIAVVGNNGSGKTTLISVILNFLKNYEGIYTNNNIIHTAILQNFGQYQMTIKENIEIGCGGTELSQDKIFDILRKVDLYDFIMTKSDGIYTKLGQLEEGVELSKGQWQRLAIGRLLANEAANVWILDEPTAYLDPLSEIEMYKLIFELSGDRLVFFISHRLGFAKNADRIIVINQGNIIEEGSHNELMDIKSGVYRQMFDLQKELYN